MFKYYIYKIGNFLVNHLPLNAAYRLGIFLSDFQYLFSFRDRKAVANNLRVIMPDEKDVSRLTHEVFRNFGMYLVEFFRIADKLDQTFIDEKIEVIDSHYAGEIQKQGKGGIFITAHIGNWEMGACVCSMLGSPTEAVALPHKERPVNDLFNYQREAKGIKIIPANIALRRCHEAIKENKFIAIAADRDFSQSGEIMDFLGKKAFIPKGAAVFSQKMNAPILPVFMTRKQDRTFTLKFEKPIYPDQTMSEEEGIADIMRQYVVIIERQIRQNPTQWMMFRKFWTE